ncbi:MAG TPA: glutamate--tRNA ligase family protein, partial [Thermodesulfobacteriota bacterium]|nr:glutamate--tRNA ligase family protein [Thermodesulfobacteriota bacterium]
KSRLDAGDPYVIRFKIPRAEEVKFKDEVRGWVVFNTKDLDDKVIWKSSDGLPTYHLANVVDDYLMEISHIIRGDEWISSTPLHVLLYRAFGWELPIYAHLPSVLGPDGKKLSKRHAEKYGFPIFPIDWSYKNEEGNDVNILGFREAGYEPDALLNFLVLLGWNPGNDVEHMTLDEMGSLFNLDRVNKAGAMFDMKKLESFNSYYLSTRDTNWILDRMDILPFGHGFSLKKLDMIAKMATERAMFASDLKNSMDYIFAKPSLDGDFKIKNLEDFEKVMEIFVSEKFMLDFDDCDWTVEHIKEELESISINRGTTIGKIMPLLRVALTGGKSGPQLPDVMYILGAEETKTRVNSLLAKLKEPTIF